MADEILKRDQNRVTVLGGVTDNSAEDIRMLLVDPTTGRLKVTATISGGFDLTVEAGATSVSNVDTIVFTGATVTDDGGGTVTVAITATGNVSKVGTPANNQIAVWTGDGTIEGANSLTYDGSNLQLTGDIGSTGTRITKGWFTDLQVTNAIAGSITGNAGTVTGFTPAGGSLTLAGADALTLTTTATTDVTLPTTGTLATLAGSEVLSSKTLTAPVINASTLTGNQNIAALPASDHTANGPTTNAIASGYTASAFDLVFLGSGGKWLEVDADAVATCKGLIGLALEAKNDTEAMLVALPGSFVRDDTWAWTVGATLYAGETLGAMQEAIPTGADAIIKVVGFAVTADVIFFNPSPDQQSTVA